MNQLQVIERQGQRVLTTNQLAEVYGADVKHIHDNFQNNESRYKVGKHYFVLQGEELRQFKASTQISGNLKFAPILYLWTEKGAWLHAKSLNTDQAWEAYEMLVDDYYQVVAQVSNLGLSPEVQAIFFLDKKTQEIENRVLHLEQTKTVDYGQQQVLNTLCKRRVVEILGGKSSSAYKQLNNKLFSAAWKSYHGYFKINSYRNTPAKEFDKAKEYLQQWSPQGELLREIEDANSQLSFLYDIKGA
ncbi:ORF6C domain-containing protein [Brevibacillus laterosporus]|uniref:ORF6C domain-containing protein n=1 Tax=Brevibacillus laterosporus TaxID=1465 RepID=A0AAP3DLF8_BRELA|nr:ORF6C domain-containing protein [Brevibacillus laterosporus]MCR8982631.1 ORF6C domain-containing protein [Brevibacillus laterosporus]MCZ0809787.1 ORF6C domain-containing protein [Brevibacillus laterosporus]MCZ0828379.1 ORF6C domain-containing protein [Brevibacillus laterosporus]MCZ0852389.1 ORF6C domain-containing protein [Brevibacillus laterosporus]